MDIGCFPTVSERYFVRTFSLQILSNLSLHASIHRCTSLLSFLSLPLAYPCTLRNASKYRQSLPCCNSHIVQETYLPFHMHIFSPYFVEKMIVCGIFDCKRFSATRFFFCNSSYSCFWVASNLAMSCSCFFLYLEYFLDRNILSLSIFYCSAIPSTLFERYNVDGSSTLSTMEPSSEQTSIFPLESRTWNNEPYLQPLGISRRMCVSCPFLCFSSIFGKFLYNIVPYSVVCSMFVVAKKNGKTIVSILCIVLYVRMGENERRRSCPSSLRFVSILCKSSCLV